MTLDLIIYCAANGAGFSLLLTLGMVMLLMDKSIFGSKHVRSGLRRTTGLTFLCWALSYLLCLSFMLIPIEDITFRNNLKVLIAMLMCIPSTFQLFYTITHVGRPSFRWTTFDVAIGCIMTLIYVFTRDVMVYNCTVALWCLRGLYFSFNYVREAHRYAKLLRNEFSDLKHLEVKWLNVAITVIVVYGFLSTSPTILNNHILWSFFLVSLLIVWTYLFYYVDTQEAIPDVLSLLQLMEESEKGGREEELMLPKHLEQQIEEQLERELIQAKLYLDPGLTINQLALKVCTNRTYLWRYFKCHQTSFNVYINERRVEHAKMLLTSTPFPSVSNVGKDSGFGSDASFRRVFTEMVGCSPSKYAKQTEK